MDVSIGEHWEGFVADTVKDGHFGSASEVVDAGLRLLKEREAKQQALRETLEASIARGGSQTSAEVMAHVEAAMDDWERRRAAQ